MQNCLAKLPASFHNHILLIEISMKKKETTKNLNDFPLRHILRPRRHALFFFLFLSQTLWVTYKFYLVPAIFCNFLERNEISIVYKDETRG